MLRLAKVKVQSLLEESFVLVRLGVLNLQVELETDLADISSLLKEMKRSTTRVAVIGKGFTKGGGAFMRPGCPIGRDMPRFEEPIALSVRAR